MLIGHCRDSKTLRTQIPSTPSGANMSFSTVTFHELQEQQGNTVLLDVRDRSEVEEQGQLESSHCVPLSELPSAISLPPDNWQAEYGFTKPTTSDSITTLCYKGGRGRQAAKVLADHGFTNVQCYEGSFKDWQDRGGRVIRPGHPFRKDDDDAPKTDRSEASQGDEE